MIIDRVSFFINRTPLIESQLIVFVIWKEAHLPYPQRRTSDVLFYFPLKDPWKILALNIDPLKRLSFKQNKKGIWQQL